MKSTLILSATWLLFAAAALKADAAAGSDVAKAEAALASVIKQLHEDFQNPRAMGLKAEIEAIRRRITGGAGGMRAEGRELAGLSMKLNSLTRQLQKLERTLFDAMPEYKDAIKRVSAAKRDALKMKRANPHAGTSLQGMRTSMTAIHKNQNVDKPITGIRNAADPKASQNLLEYSRQIDDLVKAGLAVKGKKMGGRVNDATFLRRTYLDIAGRIPTLKEYKQFKSSGSPSKRHDLIDKLIGSDAYVSNSLNYWADTLRATRTAHKVTMPAYINWIRQSIRENKPYDEFVRELLASKGPVHDPTTGGTGFYLRDTLMIEESVANMMQIFLGTSIVCAQCHDHPFNDYTQMDYLKLQAFVQGTVSAHNDHPREWTELMGKKNFNDDAYRAFSEGVYYGGVGHIKLPDNYSYRDGKPGQLVKADVPFGPRVNINYRKPSGWKLGIDTPGVEKRLRRVSLGLPDVDSRSYLADWVTSPKNPMFTKTIANRLWDRVYGAPLIGELVDMDLDDKGMNPALSDYVIKVMQAVDYDQQKFMTVLYKTDLYQRQAVNLDKLDVYVFQGPIIERLEAEKIWDSLYTLRTDDPEKEVKKGKYTPYQHYAMAMKRLKGAKARKAYATDPREVEKVRSKDLIHVPRMFHMDVRASLKRSPSGGLLRVLGQSDRTTIDGAIKDATTTQALHLMNGSAHTGLRKEAPLRSEVNKARSQQEKISLVFNAVLTREPTLSELSMVKPLFKSGEREAIEDLYWALVNSTEFKMRR